MHCPSQWGSGRFVYKDSVFGPGQFLVKEFICLHTWVATYIHSCDGLQLGIPVVQDIPDLIHVREPVCLLTGPRWEAHGDGAGEGHPLISIFITGFLGDHFQAPAWLLGLGVFSAWFVQSTGNGCIMDLFQILQGLILSIFQKVRLSL